MQYPEQRWLLNPLCRTKAVDHHVGLISKGSWRAAVGVPRFASCKQQRFGRQTLAGPMKIKKGGVAPTNSDVVLLAEFRIARLAVAAGGFLEDATEKGKKRTVTSG